MVFFISFRRFLRRIFFSLLLSINEESVDRINFFPIQFVFFGDELGGRVVVSSFYSIPIHFSRFLCHFVSSVIEFDGGIVRLATSAVRWWNRPTQGLGSYAIP